MSSSSISLGLGLGGGKSATSSGRPAGGGGGAGFQIGVLDTHANILSRTGDADGTIAYGTDTNDLYIYEGSVWIIYINNFTV